MEIKRTGGVPGPLDFLLVNGSQRSWLKLPAGAGEVLGWATTTDGMEILLYHEAGGRLRAAGAGGLGREHAVLGWLLAEGFVAAARGAADAAGPGGGGM